MSNVSSLKQPMIQDSIAWPSPAKLNLFLYITGRRSDGYHELQTLFQFIDFGDTLRFHINQTGKLTIMVSLPV